MSSAVGRRALSLVEVSVATIVLGVVAISYSSLFNAHNVQEIAVEDWVVAMELADRQIEGLRARDPILRNPPQPDPPPFREENFRLACIPFGYGGLGTNELEKLGEPQNAPPRGEFLTDTNAYRFPTDTSWLVRPAAAGGNPALHMPDDLASKGYRVVVHAARVRETETATGENQLVHYQITLQKDGQSIFVVPLYREVLP